MAFTDQMVYFNFTPSYFISVGFDSAAFLILELGNLVSVIVELLFIQLLPAE